MPNSDASFLQAILGRSARAIPGSAAAPHDRHPRIFISYRRSDSAAIVGHIYERLVARYRKDSVFRDIDKMPLGKNFYEHIRQELAGCDVVLVIVGPHWVGADSEGHARIHQPDDPVRMEVEAALESGATVIPVLVDSAAIAKPADLPQSLGEFPALAGTRINVEDFDAHLARLIQSIDRILDKRGKYVAVFPTWASRVALSCVLIGVIGLATLVLLRAGGVALASSLVLAAVIAVSGSLALACTVAVGNAAARRRIPIGFCQKRPLASGIAGGVLALALLLPTGKYLGDFFAVNPVALAKQLRTAFQEARDDLEKNGVADFRRAEALIARLKSLDEQSGHVWYFNGEIKRIQNRALFTPKGCFKGWPPADTGNLDTYQQDFHRYIDTALTLPAVETGGDSGADICYQRSKGYCAQRTAWIQHLLANDFYVHAMALTDYRDRMAALKRAGELAAEARKYRRADTGEGFDQCIETTALLQRITEELQASRAKAPRAQPH